MSGVVEKNFPPSFQKPPSPSLWRIKKKTTVRQREYAFQEKSVSYSEGFFVVVFFNRLLLLHC